jgi:hypothetical protein
MLGFLIYEDGGQWQFSLMAFEVQKEGFRPSTTGTGITGEPVVGANNPMAGCYYRNWVSAAGAAAG